MKIFDWSKIEHKGSQSGTAKVKCPECIGQRSDKTDKSLYVRYTEGRAKCFHCEALSFRDSVEKELTKKNYKLPSQEWKNYTNLSDGLVKWLEDRGIKQFTANALGFTEEAFYQPKIKKIVKNLVFNYFEGETVVNKKFRDRNKNFTQTSGTKVIFFNLNAIIGAEEVYITEGELDAASLHQIGLTWVISLPNGANNNDDFWINSESYLKDVKRFLIATDNDEKGEKVAEEIAQRLGRYRCERVLFEGKDANEDLQNGVLEKTALITKKYPVTGTFSANDLHDKVMDLYNNGLPPVLYPKHRCFGGLACAELFSVMLRHLCTVTGIPSHGKSNFVEWYVMNLVNDYGLKASFFSPEHQPLELYQSSFIEKFHGKNFFRGFPGVPQITPIDIAQYTEWANEKLYLMCADDDSGLASWDWIFERFTEQMYRYGVNIFVIDSYNTVNHTDNKPPLQQINNVLKRLTAFAQKNNVLIFLVAHPTKMQKKDKSEGGGYEMPDLYSVSGSADFRNQTHDGFVVHRIFGNDEYTIFGNLKTKMKFQGKIGSQVEFEYHLPSGRYYPKGEQPYTHCLIDLNSARKEPEDIDYYEIPKASLNDAFGEPDNNLFGIPFNPDNDSDVPF